MDGALQSPCLIISLIYHILKRIIIGGENVNKSCENCEHGIKCHTCNDELNNWLEKGVSAPQRLASLRHDPFLLTSYDLAIILAIEKKIHEFIAKYGVNPKVIVTELDLPDLVFGYPVIKTPIEGQGLCKIY